MKLRLLFEAWISCELVLNAGCKMLANACAFSRVVGWWPISPKGQYLQHFL
jgi:hypothetical protein